MQDSLYGFSCPRLLFTESKKRIMIWRVQGLRFIIVGLTSNALLYTLYIIMTAFGTGHKTAMTLLFIMGVVQTFIFNKRWTFSYSGVVRHAFWRYSAVYGAGYLINLAALAVCVDVLGWPHQVVQGVTISILAIGLFLTQKYWVFSKVRSAHGD